MQGLSSISRTSPKWGTKGQKNNLRKETPPRSFAPALAWDQDYISQQPPRRALSLPRGLRLRRRPAGGATATSSAAP